MRKDYDKLVAALREAKLPCKVKLTPDEIQIDAGWNYPEKFYHKIEDVVEATGIKSEWGVSAGSSGFKILASNRIAGGPKSY